MTPYQKLILQTIQTLGDNAYGVTIYEAAVKATGREQSLANIYITLDHLEDHEYIITHRANPTPERGDRPKRYAYITSKGQQALS